MLCNCWSLGGSHFFTLKMTFIPNSRGRELLVRSFGWFLFWYNERGFRTALSSSGLGHWLLRPRTGVRIPVGSLYMTDIISFNDFSKLEIRIGRIVAAEKVPEKDRLLILTVSLGTETRQLVAGIAQWYAPEDLIGKQIPILVNLEPKTLAGIESQGMILAIDHEQKPILLVPEEPVVEGSLVR